MADARSSRLARLALRLSGQPSADAQDVYARLDAALAANSSQGQPAARPPRSVQVVGEAHPDPASYHRWRAQQLRNLPGAIVPELEAGQWALVLWALRPALLMDFARFGKTKGLLTAPVVGRFGAGVEHDVALAGTLAGWLEEQDAPLALAPPLLRDARGPYRLAALNRDWPLPATELLLALPGNSPAKG